MARVLVVDDQKVSRATVAAILNAAGHAVESASSGPERRLHWSASSLRRTPSRSSASR
jgi:CheY-like chemotaxis protein